MKEALRKLLPFCTNLTIEACDQIDDTANNYAWTKTISEENQLYSPEADKISHSRLNNLGPTGFHDFLGLIYKS